MTFHVFNANQERLPPFTRVYTLSQSRSENKTPAKAFISPAKAGGGYIQLFLSAQRNPFRISRY